MSLIKGVFFDAAGTLFQTREPVGETYARIARPYGMDASAETVDARFGRSFRDNGPLAFGPGHPPDELRRLERNWWYDLVAKTFVGMGHFTDFEAYFNSLFDFFADPANWVADPEALPTFRALHQQGLTIGVISNFDDRLYRIFEGLGLRRWFDSITISSEVGFAKPSAKLFEAALERHRLIPAEALHVGDSEHLDLAGALSAGMTAVLLNRELSYPTRIQGRTAEISSLRQVLNVIEFLQRSNAVPHS
jgi:putative hydrolase of the HAD superfamily